MTTTLFEVRERTEDRFPSNFRVAKVYVSDKPHEFERLPRLACFRQFNGINGL